MWARTRLLHSDAITGLPWQPWLPWLPWLLCLLWAVGCASPPPDPDAVDRLYRLSGLAARVASTAEAIQSAVAMQFEQAKEAPVAGLADRVQRAYAPERLEATVLQELAQRYDEELAADSSRWLESELGRRITREGLAGATLAGTARLSEFAASLRSEPPSEARVALARKYDASTGASDFHVDLTVATARAVASALNAALPEAQRGDPADIRTDIEARLAALRPMLGSMATLAFLYSVRDASDAEVSRYVDFAASEAGQWYHRTTFEAYLAAVADAAERINAASGAAHARGRPQRA